MRSFWFCVLIGNIFYLRDDPERRVRGRGGQGLGRAFLYLSIYLSVVVPLYICTNNLDSHYTLQI